MFDEGRKDPNIAKTLKKLTKLTIYVFVKSTNPSNLANFHRYPTNTQHSPSKASSRPCRYHIVSFRMLFDVNLWQYSVYYHSYSFISLFISLQSLAYSMFIIIIPLSHLVFSTAITVFSCSILALHFAPDRYRLSISIRSYAVLASS